MKKKVPTGNRTQVSRFEALCDDPLHYRDMFRSDRPRCVSCAVFEDRILITQTLPRSPKLTGVPTMVAF